MIRRRRRRSRQVAPGAAVLTLALLLPGMRPGLASAAGPVQGPAAWLQWAPATHSATLTLTASYNAARQGFNFNGYSTGTMVISVPRGTRVEVTFYNNGPMPHSALITDYASRTRDGVVGFPLAFAGAHTTSPRRGTPAGRSERFAFVANRVGRYAVVCSVGQHARAGMWDTFVVTRGGDAYLQVPQR